MARTNATRQSINNLIRNGDFEFAPEFTAATTTSGKFIDGTALGSATNNIYAWAITGNAGFAASFDATQSHSGATCLKLSTTATGSYVEAYRPDIKGSTAGQYFGKNIPITPSTSYTYSFWMKTNYVSGGATNGACLTLLFSNDVGTGTGATAAVTSPIVKTTTDWTQYTGTFTANAVTNYVQISCRVYGHQGTATLIMDAWFDDITLSPTTPITRLPA